MSKFENQFGYATPIYPSIDTQIPSAPPMDIIQQADIKINYGIPVEKMERFQFIVESYNINTFFAMRLRELDGYEIVIICDDSGSMSYPVTKPENIFDRTESRWEEAQKSIKIIVDIASVFDSDGVDIYYLNRKPILNVYTSEELEFNENFKRGPNGSTPLGEILQKVLSAKKSCERSLLIIIFTDGAPDNLKLFKSVLANRKPIDKIFVSLVACTDDFDAIGYLNELDTTIKNVDTNDDYHSERKEILQVQGTHFSFTFGDYICKILLGPVCPYFDKLDEHKLNQKELGAIKQKPSALQKKKDSCTIC